MLSIEEFPIVDKISDSGSKQMKKFHHNSTDWTYLINTKNIKTNSDLHDIVIN